MNRVEQSNCNTKTKCYEVKCIHYNDTYGRTNEKGDIIKSLASLPSKVLNLKQLVPVIGNIVFDHIRQDHITVILTCQG